MQTEKTQDLGMTLRCRKKEILLSVAKVERNWYQHQYWTKKGLAVLSVSVLL